jgi:putative ubiquitin-RnfH superfamily antitoxin RatB of RatAB toxin-antitoxin module
MARLRIEVVHPLAGEQAIVRLELAAGATAGEAALASGLPQHGLQYGIGGKLIAPETPLRDGDRLELLRPLAADPKEARRQRARKAKRR